MHVLAGVSFLKAILSKITKGRYFAFQVKRQNTFKNTFC